MEQKSINIGGIGPVVFTKYKQARRLKLMVRPGNEIRVSMPRSYSYRRARHYVEGHREWIRQSLEEMGEKFAGNNHHIYEDGQQISPSRYLKIRSCMGDDIYFLLNDNNLEAFVPLGKSLKETGTQKAIDQAVGEALKAEAKQTLPPRLREIASQTGLTRFGRITVRNNVSRWGSCSSNNNISLAAKLILLPVHLRDYVILHELAHTVEKNHGPRFWALVEHHSKHSIQRIKQEMRTYSLRLAIRPH